MRRFLDDMRNLEREVNTITVNDKNVKVEFKLNELPNDMKIAGDSFLAGELSNAATFFTTFANVNRKDAMDIKKSFGTNKTSSWKTFTYESRVEVAKKVEKFKEKNLERNTSPPWNDRNFNLLSENI